jgi:two-component system NarL family sensor kinase
MVESAPSIANARFPLWTIPFGIACLLIPLAFIILHLAIPSDGMRLSSGNVMFTYNGVLVSPYSPDEQVLAEGDVVIAVEGQSLENFARSLFIPGLSRPRWQIGNEVIYTIERDGELVDKVVPLSPLPVKAIFSGYWGALLFAFASQVLAIFVLARKPHDPAAQAFFIWALAGSHTYAWSFSLQVSDITGVLGFWLFRLATPGLWLIYWPAGLHMALVFPRKLPLVKRRRWLIPSLYLASFAIYFMLLALSWIRTQNILLWLDSWSLAEGLIAGLFLVSTLGTIIYQYRSSLSFDDRVKMRWAVFGASVAGIIGLIFWILLPMITGESILSPNLLGLIMLLFPISLAVAIVRHHLFDIDHIIRRTLVYGILTAALLGIYFLSVILLQQIIRGTTGATSPLVIVVSTLLIAALFNPLRGWVQEAIDRRFYRQKYDATQILAAFANTVRNEVELDAMTGAVLRVVEDTLQPERASLWLIDSAGQPSNIRLNSGISENQPPRPVT